MLEVMLAIAIFAGVLTAIYSSWASVTRGTRIGLSAAASAQRARVASRALEDALATVTVFQDNITNYAFVAEMNGDYSSVEFTSYLPESFPGFGIFDGMPVRRIRFSVESGTNGSPQLVMTQMPYLLTISPDQQPYAIVLAKDVSVFALHFWDTNANEWVDEWIQNTNQVPRLIRYEMAFDDKGDKRSVAGISSGLVAPASVAVPPSGFAQGSGGGVRPKPGANNPQGNPNNNPNGAPNNSINNLNTSTPGRNAFLGRNPGYAGNSGLGGAQGGSGFNFGSGQNNLINNSGSGGNANLGGLGGFGGNSAGYGGGGIGGAYGRGSITTGTVPPTTKPGVSIQSGIGGTTVPNPTNSGVSSSSSIINSTNPPGVIR